MLVALHPNKQSNFLRTIKDKDGKIVKRLEFGKKQTVELKAKEVEVVADDIGQALVVVKMEKTENKESVYRVDWGATSKFGLERAEAKQKDADKRGRKDPLLTKFQSDCMAAKKAEIDAPKVTGNRVNPPGGKTAETNDEGFELEGELKDLKKPALIDACKKLGLEFKESMTKAELIELIESTSEEVGSEDDDSEDAEKTESQLQEAQ